MSCFRWIRFPSLTFFSLTSVIRVVLQFLKENSLHSTFDALVQETGVHLNTVENTSLLSSAIRAGEWDLVLREVASVELSDSVQADMYEQIALELVDLRELDTARKLLRTRPLRVLQNSSPERFVRLEAIFQRGVVEAADWPSGSKKKNRKYLAKTVVAELAVAPPSRLLALMGQALKWQRHMGQLPPGMSFSLFRDRAPVPKREDEQAPSLGLPPIVFAKGCRPVCAAFSPDGRSLATGSTDGFVEVWNWMRSKLRTDLAYQAKDELMLHDCDVVCLAFSKDSELIASGDAKGSIKIWQVSTGKCVRRFKGAHERGITDIVWSSDCGKIVTASLDGTLRMHGLRSGKTIKFFRGHQTFVHRCLYVSGGLASCSTDGTVRIWDKNSGDLRKTITVADLEAAKVGVSAATGGLQAPIVDLVCGRDKEELIFCNRTAIVYRVGLAGELLHKYVASDETTEIVAVAVSSLGKFVYGASLSGTLHAWNFDTGVEEAKLPLHDKECVRLIVHPHSNVLCVLAMDQKALLFRQSGE